MKARNELLRFLIIASMIFCGLILGDSFGAAREADRTAKWRALANESAAGWNKCAVDYKACADGWRGTIDALQRLNHALDGATP